MLYLLMDVYSSEIYLHYRSTFTNLCSKIIHRKSKLRKIEYFFMVTVNIIRPIAEEYNGFESASQLKRHDEHVMHAHDTTCIQYRHQNEKTT